MTTLLVLVFVAALWAVLRALVRRNDRLLRERIHSYNRLPTEGELLPALREGEPWDAPAPVIRIPRPDPAPMSEIETRRPTRTPTLESDVLVPGAQAAFTAVAAAIVAGLLCWAFSWPLRVVLVATAATLALAWLWRLRLVDGLLWSVERLLQHDVNHDGAVGRPHDVTLVNPSVARATVTALTTATAGATRQRDLLAFAEKCYLVGTSENAHGIRAGGPDRDRYLEHRDALLSLGVARWRNPERPKAGWALAVTREEAANVITAHVL